MDARKHDRHFRAVGISRWLDHDETRDSDTTMQTLTPPKTHTSYRLHTWLNTKTMEPVYGIQGKRDGAKWTNCAVDGKALLYNNAETAKRHLRWLRDPKGTAPEWDTDSVV